ncbi:MAG: tail protein X [Phycisphaerae bacterium]
MARETKIGLLAGLSFIICFALILANRGSPPPLTTYQPHLVDHGEGYHRPPAQPLTTPSVRPSNAARFDRSVADGVASAVATSGAEVILPGQGASATGVSSPEVVRTHLPEHATSKLSAHKTNLATVSLSPGDEPDGTGDRALTSRSQEQAARRRALEDALNARQRGKPEANQSTRQQPADQTGSSNTRAQSDRPLADGRRAVQPASRSTPEPTPTRSPTPAHPVRYTVVPGDALCKIAAAHYGSESAAIINAIFEANRSVLSSPDMLRVGVELTLPVIDGVNGSSGGESAAGPRIAARVQEPVSTPAPEQGLFRWYQIKKKDRYMSIAREQLGSASRWREIYELNNDKFPDPQRIQWGVRIKLPVTGVASAGGRGR